MPPAPFMGFWETYGSWIWSFGWTICLTCWPPLLGVASRLFFLSWRMLRQVRSFGVAYEHLERLQGILDEGPSESSADLLRFLSGWSFILPAFFDMVNVISVTLVGRLVSDVEGLQWDGSWQGTQCRELKRNKLFLVSRVQEPLSSYLRLVVWSWHNSWKCSDPNWCVHTNNLLWLCECEKHDACVGFLLLLSSWSQLHHLQKRTG